MKTFSIQTLGCKVNQYEGEQIAALLRARGLVETDPAQAELRVVNTCSVTVQAGSKSRQTARRNVRLPLLTDPSPREVEPRREQPEAADALIEGVEPKAGRRARVVLTGCWATSDRSAAAGLPGVDAVLTHQDDVAAELDQLLHLWRGDEVSSDIPAAEPHAVQSVALQISPMTARKEADGWMERAGREAGERTKGSKSGAAREVNVNHAPPQVTSDKPARIGTTSLPLLGQRQTGRQRALLKVQDGCDAHCTYCIIPKLRPGVWSKPIDDAVREATALVASGHAEIVLNGIFLGAYGQPTALRRRQTEPAGATLGRLVEALCTRVPGLRRLRLSSLEPGDLTDGLVDVLRSHSQVVPHFHLPLQSGSDELLRRMNRQYGRGDFLRMIDRVRNAFDRPALTTDVIVGFPGETDEEFERTVEVVDHAGFIHVHAFSFSPRPGTAAARWTKEFVHGPVVNERIERLTERATAHSLAFRNSFVGEEVELLVEQEGGEDNAPARPAADGVRHGRCERWFDVHFADDLARPGNFVRVRVDRVTPTRTHGTLVKRLSERGVSA